MEATALSVGKSVLDGALGYAKSALAEEVALQLGVQRDHAFIRGELEMMQAFLKVAHDERDNHEVLMAWVKQVRDVAYDAEDCLQDFSIHLHKPSSWWHLPSTLKVRRRIAKQMKELRARVEDVSQRNLRYQLIKSSSSKLTTSFQQSNITAAAIFGVDDAWRAANQDNSKVDLVHLILQEGEDLKVIGVWGTCGDLGQTSIINEAYENLDIQKKFPCRAWVRVLHPFNPNDFIQSLVKQFRSAEGIGSLLEAEKTGKELAEEFTRYVNQNSYMIVLSGLSTFEEWKGIRTCFPNNKKGSRIIVSTPQAQVSSLCAGQESQVLKLKQLSADEIIYVSYEKSAAKEDNSKVDLIHLIQQEGEDLRVIAVWGTSGDLGQASIINEAYENPDIKKKFPCRAWVRVLHPFNPIDFIQSLVKQFRSAEGIDILLEAEKTREQLTEEFKRYVNKKSYLIVLNGLSTVEEWKGITTCFPNNKKGSRIIVCTPQAEVASLCAGQGSQVLELKQLSIDQTIYAFYDKGCHDRTNSSMSTLSSLNTATTCTFNSTASTNEILENQSKCGNERKVVTKSFTRMKTMENALEESQLIGRKKETDDMIKLISNELGQQFLVISVWGMGGIGKTTLVKNVYQNQNLIGKFEKRAFVTVMRPFNLKELLHNLFVQLSAEPSQKKGPTDFWGGTRSKLAMLGEDALREKLETLLKNKCLIVLDDVSSTAEWDTIIRNFPEMEKTSRIIVTTREEDIAKHCSDNKQENLYILKFLEDNIAFDLFTRKVSKEKETIDWDKHPELLVQAKSILKKCSGLPLAIVTIGGFLRNQPKTAFEWKKINEHISAELEINPELEAIKTILGKSYDGLPYHLKSCFLYMSIFPEDHKVSRRRLIQRWTAEGYSRDIREKPANEVADRYFMELIGRSMILPCRESLYSRNGIDSCQVHDLMREISITKSIEENLVLRLEEGCNLNTHGVVRHLTISSNWEGDKEEFEGAVDLSRIRSLTVFGKWRPFFMSAKMCLLRVLDLENTVDLRDHHLREIGKLLHLKYLSLRGCRYIFHLSDSLGNLKQLQTLDIKYTGILKLPNTIINLRKLQYIYAGTWLVTYDEIYEDVPKLLQNKICILTGLSIAFCAFCCAPQLTENETINRRDVCTRICCSVYPSVLMELSGYGVVLPRGLRKLRVLHTLSTVDISVGKHILKDIKSLTQLRRLGVTGINKKNCQDFCSTLDDLNNLESLSVHSTAETGLCGCLDGVSSPPKSLQSLKLAGSLIRLPEWIEGLHNLVKLKLQKTKLSESDATIQVLGKLPNLTILRLLEESFKGEKLRLIFQRDAFPNLMVLQLKKLYIFESVEFEAGATPKLELLVFYYSIFHTSSISGLSSLSSLKEVVIKGSCREELMRSVRDQVSRNPNKAITLF